LLTSKEVLEKTGISRATLNNYISWGIVARPDVLPPEPQDGAAPRIGYFPEAVIERIEEIQRLKRDGWSINRIAEHFGAPPPAAPAQEAPVSPAPAAAMSAPAAPAKAVPDGLPTPKRAPALTEVAVLVTGLQDASRLWSELPAQDYFELIDQIWLTLDPIFRRHGGAHGKHPGEGMVCYFLPRADSSHLVDALAAALETREAMRRVSKEWQLRKGWATELFMNSGIDEGREWLGTLRSGNQAEFTVIGDAVTHATLISGFSRKGAIWATRNLVGKLRLDERRRLKYGVRRKAADGRDVFVLSTFARIENLADPPGSDVPRAIARLPVAEIVEISP
jgi:class 3 adenylate cyclase